MLASSSLIRGAHWLRVKLPIKISEEISFDHGEMIERTLWWNMFERKWSPRSTESTFAYWT